MSNGVVPPAFATTNGAGESNSERGALYFSLVSSFCSYAQVGVGDDGGDQTIVCCHRDGDVHIVVSARRIRMRER
jgi:hypothetical protein